MRIPLIVLLLVVCLNLSTFAIGDSAGVVIHQIAISYGIGIPTGAFASTATIGSFQGNITSGDESGYALNSTNLDLTYTARNKAHPYGFLATFRKSSFGYDMDAALVHFTNGATWTGQGESWKTTIILLGFFRHVPIGRSFSLEPKAALGMLFLGSKKMTMTGTGGQFTVPQTWEFSNESSSAAAFLFGVNLRYKITNAIGLFASFDFFSSTPTVDYTTKGYVNVPVLPGTFSQTVSAWTFLGGISISTTGR